MENTTTTAKPVYTTEKIGMVSCADNLADALAVWSKSREIVAIAEPQDVIIRQRIDGYWYLKSAKQVAVKFRFSKRGGWWFDVMTFDMEQYGKKEG